MIISETITMPSILQLVEIATVKCSGILFSVQLLMPSSFLIREALTQERSVSQRLEDTLQAEKAGELNDTDFIRLQAEKAEFDRAKERLTLKHKNTSQWARRALKRGVDLHADGTVPLPPADLSCRKQFPSRSASPVPFQSWAYHLREAMKNSFGPNPKPYSRPLQLASRIGPQVWAFGKIHIFCRHPLRAYVTPAM